MRWRCNCCTPPGRSSISPATAHSDSRCTELDTARRLGLPAVTIIHNNAAWGIIQAGQRSQLDFELGTSLAGTDYAAIARGFGCLGETVSEPDALGPALRRALSSGLPSVIDCQTCFVPHPSLPAFGRMNRYGFDALTARPRPDEPPASPASVPIPKFASFCGTPVLANFGIEGH